MEKGKGIREEEKYHDANNGGNITKYLTVILAQGLRLSLEERFETEREREKVDRQIDRQIERER